MIKVVYRRKLLLLTVVLCVMLVIPAYGYGIGTIEKMNTILPKNIWLDKVYLGGMTLSQVEQLIDEAIEGELNKTITVISQEKIEGQKQIYTLKELGFSADKERIKSQIWTILNNDMGWMDKYKNYRSIEERGEQFAIAYTVDRDAFERALDAFEGKDLAKPIDAKYIYQDGNVIIKEGTLGYTFNKEELLKEIIENPLEEENNAFYLRVKEVKPEVTAATLQNQGIKEKVASFTTTFSAGKVERSSNIHLAASFIDGKVLAPGEIFSFNEIVGRRTKARGFKEAGVYVNGRLDTGVGGGICQVSTTLYNAVLLADLEVIERSNHSLTVPYVPLSRDAVIDWGSKDFKFKNNTEAYIYIRAATEKGSITFDLFSTKSGKSIELVSTVLGKTEPVVKYEKDQNLLEGEEVVVEKGQRGYRSQLLKKVYENGELIRSEVVSVDRYLAAPKIVKTGTKKVEE
ncbi:MAG: VanW family protein [Thermotaleaceae bacterium]